MVDTATLVLGVVVFGEIGDEGGELGFEHDMIEMENEIIGLQLIP